MQSKNKPNKQAVEYLYYLMKELISQNITPRSFCDEFYECFDIGIDLSLLNPKEQQEFEKLSNVAGRFSEFEEDRVKFPNAYCDENKLKSIVIEVMSSLAQERKGLPHLFSQE